MAHIGARVFVAFDDRFVNIYMGPSAQKHSLDDFNADNFDHGGQGFIRGAQISITPADLEAGPIGAAMAMNPPPQAPAERPAGPTEATETASPAGALQCSNCGADRVSADLFCEVQSEAALASLRQRGDVVYAEPNHILTALSTPNDSSYASQWAPKKIQADLAWGIWTPRAPVTTTRHCRNRTQAGTTVRPGRGPAPDTPLLRPMRAPVRVARPHR